jgi:hypothetical protein
MTKYIERLIRLAQALPGLAVAVFLTGCHMPPPQLPKILPDTKKYAPSNVYRRSPVLDRDIKRVAVLPMTPLLPTEAFQAGIDSLQPVLDAELEKSKRFELIVVTPEQLRRWSGQGTWRADEKLPTDFFERLHEETGCQAVFFDQLTRYEPYQPVAIGWKLTLVVDKDQLIFWSADEVFDAGDDSVANAARAYEGTNITSSSPLPDPNAILSSPSRFGQYTLEALLSTLPQR